MIEIDTSPLNKLIKSIKENESVARVGILGSKDARIKGSNATIGKKHEFGEDGMPVRSFLRVPIIENMQGYLEKSGAFSREALNEVVKSGTIIPWLKKIAVIGETIVLDAFHTGGFGKWKVSNMRFKKNHQTLIETQQLRNSITSEVK